jgi:hypothetical protein
MIRIELAALRQALNEIQEQYGRRWTWRVWVGDPV